MNTMDLLKMRTIADKKTIEELRDRNGLLCMNLAAQEADLHELRHENAKLRATIQKLHDRLDAVDQNCD